MIKNIFRYILVIATVAAFASCSVDEIDNVGSKGVVKFVVQPTNYIGCDVSAGSTKASAVDFENKIVNAHFLLFNADGERMLYEPLNVTDNTIPTHVVDMDLHKGVVTACFIANAPANVVESIDNITDLNNTVLDLNYASYEESGYLGVPKLGNELCFPMYGSVTQSITSREPVRIQLRRLFSKISVKLNMNLTSTGTLGLQTNTYFKLISYNLVNLPNKVRLVNNGKESDWVKNSSAFVTDNSKLIVPSLDEKIYNAGAVDLTSSQKKEYTFDLYVPEYSVAPISSPSELPENKPKNFAQGKRPVYLQIFGVYTPVSGSTNNMTYNVYLGENNNTSFTLNRNIQYNNLLTIKGISKAEVDHRVSIEAGNLVNMFGEVANCYVISQTGQYRFPAYKGAFKLAQMTEENMCKNGTYVEIIDRTNTNVSFYNYGSASNPQYFTLEEDNNGAKVICFEITSMDDSNVVIGLKDDSGNIEWSWHLWFVKGPTLGNINTGFFDIDVDNMPSGGAMMDRNLGAEYSLLGDGLSPGMALGLYYQYGRKEPFFNNKYQGGGVSDRYNWIPEDPTDPNEPKLTKSHTDPCPPGYRVPSGSVWNSAPTPDHYMNYFRFSNNGTTIDLLDDIYYPYSGYINESGNKVTQNTNSENTVSGYNRKIPQSQTNLNTYSTNYTLYTSGPIEFTDVKYTTYSLNNIGYSSAKDKVFQYSYIGNGIEINSCKLRVGTWKRSGNILTGKMNANYSGNPLTLDGETLKNNYPTAYKKLIAVLNGGSGTDAETSDLFDRIMNAWKDKEVRSDVLEIPSTSNGYQVRCLKEPK